MAVTTLAFLKIWELCVRRARLDNALRILHALDHRIDSSIYACLLQGCIKKKALFEGKLVHAHMTERGCMPEIFLANILVTMYSKCGNVMDARRVLDQMPIRNVVSWTAMIAGYAQNGHVGQALTLFYQMKRTGIEPNQFTVATVLPACANIGALKQGKEIHEEIIRSGIQSNVFVENALVDMYAKCRSLDNARHMFDKMPKRDVISWNTMIAGYVQNGYMKEAFELFQKMPEPNVVSWTAMIAGYAQIGYVDEALKLFQKIVEPDVVSWNAMVAGYVQNGYVEEALNHFQQMKLAGMKPNSKTFAALLPACADLAVLEMGKEVHEDIIRSGLQSDVFVGSALVDMYTKCGSIENARIVFDKLPHRDVVSWNTMVAGYAHSGNVNEALELFNKMPQRDVVSWNAMIAVYIQNGHVEEALKLFQKMPVRDVVSWNAMISGYTQSGDVEEALKLFQKMPKRDVVSWNVMIAGYAQNGHSEEALKLFREMQLADMKPNLETFTIILLACANLAVMEHGKEAHEIVIRSGFQSDVFVGNTLVGMYAKSGSLEDAGRVFDKMPQRDVISWTTMIVGYAIHGCGKEALELFQHMQDSGTNPNHVTFVGVLSACCHAGLVDEGWQYFDRMSEYRITPAMEHYGCMVDLLGRAGQLEKALDFINKMPIKPDAALWGSLLGACSTHGNIDLGEHVAELLFELNPEDSATYVLLSNMYAAAGRWVDIQKVRKMMKDRRVKKKPGCSWIEVNKQVYAFLVGER
eukprot:Gb_08223 [translate_table: standard]